MATTMVVLVLVVVTTVENLVRWGMAGTNSEDSIHAISYAEMPQPSQGSTCIVKLAGNVKSDPDSNPHPRESSSKEPVAHADCHCLSLLNAEI